MPYHQVTIRVSEPFRSNVIQKCIDLGSTGAVEEEEILIVYFPESVPLTVIMNELDILKAILKTAHNGPLTYEHSLFPDADWNESWKANFKPVDVGNTFVILPPWEELQTDRIKLIIDPGMAFGTGHHETTRACLLLMEHYIEQTLKDSFLDVGTGTGILAIAASKIGFRKVVGIDNDPLAIEAAQKNFALNTVRNGDLREVTITQLDGTYDCITANLFSSVLMQLAPELSSHLNNHGLLIIAGILAGQQEEVFSAMKKQRMKLIKERRDNKWISAAFEIS